VQDGRERTSKGTNVDDVKEGRHYTEVKADAQVREKWRYH